MEPTIMPPSRSFLKQSNEYSFNHTKGGKRFMKNSLIKEPCEGQTTASEMRL